MGNLIDAAASILSNTEKKLETISNNIANTSTPGFKRIISTFTSESKTNHNEEVRTSQIFDADTSQGTLRQTDSALDVAISGDGYFLLRRDDEYFLTRSGKFSRGPEGILQNAEGLILQFAGGADATVESDAIEILTDGTLLDRGVPAGKIGIYAAPAGAAGNKGGGQLRTAGEPAEMDDGAFEIRQGRRVGRTGWQFHPCRREWGPQKVGWRAGRLT